jgi:hypothetical protein
MGARWARMGWWGMAAVVATLGTTGRRVQAQSGQAQTGQGQPGQMQRPDGVPAQNPAVRTEHTPPRRPDQMKGVPSPETPAPQDSGSSTQSGGIAPQKTAEEVLAELVKRAGIILVGQVYAIRMPAGEANPGTSGGLHSSMPHVVEIEFRVDQGVRGTSIGEPFVLRETEEQWRKGPQFTPHERVIVFLYPPDKDGLSAPVGGAVGVLPRSDEDEVDLTRLHALVEGTPAQPAAANGPAGEGSAGQAAAEATGNVTGKGTGEGTGEASLTTEVSGERMPELNGARAPFLAVLRDIYVLTAEEQRAGAAKSGV